MREYQLKNPFTEPRRAADPFSTPRKVFTVSELTRQIEDLFKERFSADIWVEGELSDPKVYPSGHLWFDLKDATSTLKSVMWKMQAAQLKFQPEQGLQVICSGKVDFYAPRGEVKFVVRSLEPKGLGALQLAFEQLKNRLQKEGLFDEVRKRPLPAFPQRVGIVTSPRGAAIDDILKVLRGQVQVVIFPSRVQGEYAADAIARGIRQMNGLDGIDLLIVGRGGGSVEDLWSFNEEIVARAIAASKLPVISAVGHEKDVTIADLVADSRAPTPTRSAEMVLAQRRGCFNRLSAVLENSAFTEPQEWLTELKEQVEEHSQTLVDGFREPILDAAHRLTIFHGELLRCSPRSIILQQAEKLHRLHLSLETGMARILEQTASRFLGLVGRLHALSPLAVLERGYSITFDSHGKIVKEAKRVKPGDLIQTRLHRGELTSRVEYSGEK